MTALSRRGLLSVIGAIAGTGATGVSPAAAIAAGSIAAREALSAPIEGRDVAGWDDPPVPSSLWDASREVRKAIHKAHGRLHNPIPMPVSVRSKRSWSDSYKEAVAHKEADRIADALDALDNEHGIKAILRALGIEVPA